MYKINTLPKKNRFTRKKKLLFVGIGILLIALVVLCLELTNTTYFFHKKSLIVKHKDTASQSTKGEPATSDSSESASSQDNKDSGTDSTASDNKSENSPSTSTTLDQPTGTFVSNHHPNLSGKPAPNTLTSDCTTTSGATCQITFTNTSTGETKSLPAQTTDRGGSAYWSWQLQDIALTSGSWQVKAVATLNGQTKTATDAMNLEVQQ